MLICFNFHTRKHIGKWLNDGIFFLFQLANYLKDIGVKKGDAVIIYLPMLMELPIAMLACARIGAVHSVSHKNLKCFRCPPFLV